MAPFTASSKPDPTENTSMEPPSEQLGSPSLSPLPWWKKLLEHATTMPRFRFMVHDKWANVLFLHWRVPVELEATLRANTDPFLAERFDGSVWIGLILLSEENVGPTIGRSQWTCVTHHGINVRTYVEGVVEHPKASNNSGSDHSQGIHFSSLECDDEFTSAGANFFGMPYNVAKMNRRYSSFGRGHDSTGVAANKLSSPPPSSTLSPSSHRCYYTIRSERLPSASPSFFRILFHSLNWWRPRLLHSTEREKDASDLVSSPAFTTTNIHGHETSSTSSPSSPSSSSISSSQRFTVDCSWSRCCSHDTHTHETESTKQEKQCGSKEPLADDSSLLFHEWATERYFVYTHKYGRNWRGQVDHEPWPLEPSNSIRLEGLEISGIDAYEPKSMRPILRHMANHRPEHVGFSQGVGPVVFTMLQPV